MISALTIGQLIIVLAVFTSTQFLFLMWRADHKSHILAALKWLLAMQIGFDLSLFAYVALEEPLFVRFYFAFNCFALVAVSVLCERVMRRHLPPLFKWYLLLSTSGLIGACFLIPQLLGSLAMHSLVAHGALVLSACAGLLLLARQRKDLEGIERVYSVGLIAVLLATAVVIAVPYFANNPNGSGMGSLEIRLTPIGIQLLSLTFILLQSNAHPSRVLAREYLAIGIKAAAVTFFFGALFSIERPTDWILLGALSTTLTLAAAVSDHLRQLRNQEKEDSFLAWLSGSQFSSKEEFCNSLKTNLLTHNYLCLKGDELQQIDVPKVSRFLENRTNIPSLDELKKLVTGDKIPAECEQLLYLLNKHKMTHVTLLDDSPAELVLFAYPKIPSRTLAYQTNIVHRIAQVVRRRTSQKKSV